MRYRLAFEASKLDGAMARLEIYWGGQKLNWQGTGGPVPYIDPTTSGGVYHIDLFGGTGAGQDKNRLTFVEIGGGDADGTLLDNIRFYEVEEGQSKADDADPLSDGNDVITLGSGADMVFGNGGDDTATFSDQDGNTDHYNGGAGTDMLVMNWANAAEAIVYGVLASSDQTSFGQAESYRVGTSPQRLYFKEVERFILTGGLGSDVLIMDWPAASSAIFRNIDGSYKSYSHTITVVNHGSTEYFYTMLFSSVERFDLTGGGANDFLYGGAFADRLNGGSGRDVLDLGAGANTLIVDWTGYGYGVNDSDVTEGSLAAGYGGNFNTTHGSTNRVDFTGAEHFDLTLTDHADAITTGDGNDSVIGNGGGDVLRAGRGIDTIDGTATITGIEMLTLATGAGNDIITTLAADFNDTVTTDGGSDWVKVAGGRDGAHLGLGRDWLVVDWTGYGYGVADSGVGEGTLSDGYGGNFNTPHGSSNRVDFSGVEHFHLTLTEHADVITVGDGNDVVNGMGGGDTLRTGKGVDVVRGGSGNDRWVVDKSFLTQVQAMVLNLTKAPVQATYRQDGTVWGIEMLSLITGAGKDKITTLVADFNDEITTNAGADRVTVAGGRDVVHTGAGADTLVLDWTGYGYGVFANVTGSLATGYSGDFNTIHGSTNRVDFTGVEKFNLTLTGHADTVTTGDGADRIDGAGGADEMAESSLTARQAPCSTTPTATGPAMPFSSQP